MSMKLTSDREHMVLENRRLVHHLVQKLGIMPFSRDYEDIISEGNIGLIKAAITFDSSKKNTFATYAAKCINNEIFGYWRKNKKYLNDRYINEPIKNDKNEMNNEITLEETIEDPNSDFVEKIENKEELMQIISITLNCLKGKNRIVMLYKMGGISQEDIKNRIGVSQSYVSRLESKNIIKIKRIVNNQLKYKDVFSITVIGDEYGISFSIKNINKFDEIFETVIQKSVGNLPDFKLGRNKERITIQIPIDPESLYFIAQIIQKLDNFNMV